MIRYPKFFPLPVPVLLHQTLPAVLLLFVLPLLAVLVSVSLLDPIWIPGIYDDGDYDDVIGLLTSDAAPTDRSTDLACSSPPLSADLSPAHDTAGAGVVVALHPVRAPPSA